MRLWGELTKGKSLRRAVPGRSSTRASAGRSATTGPAARRTSRCRRAGIQPIPTTASRRCRVRQDDRASLRCARLTGARRADRVSAARFTARAELLFSRGPLPGRVPLAPLRPGVGASAEPRAHRRALASVAAAQTGPEQRPARAPCGWRRQRENGTSVALSRHCYPAVARPQGRQQRIRPLFPRIARRAGLPRKGRPHRLETHRARSTSRSKPLL